MKTSNVVGNEKASLAIEAAIASINNSGITLNQKTVTAQEQTFFWTDAQLGWKMTSSGLFPWLVEGISVFIYNGSLIIRQATPQGELGDVKISESVVTPVIIEAVIRSMLGLVF